MLFKKFLINSFLVRQLCVWVVFFVILSCGLKRNIYWESNRRLTFNDFKYKPYAKGKVTGSSTTYITKEYKNNKKSIFYYSRAKLNRKDSWIKYKYLSVLNHEQRHFDIQEFYSRYFIIQLDSLKNLNLLNKDNFKSKQNTLYNKIIKISNKFHDKYDDETNHGIKRDIQKLWDVKIDSLLQETSFIRNNLKYHVVDISNN